MRGRTVRVALEPLLMTAVVLAVAIGSGIASGAGYLASSGPGEGFADLGAVVLGLLIGVSLGTLLWVVGLIWLSRRLFEPGRRAGAVWFSLGFAVVAVVLMTVLTPLLGSGPTGLELTAVGLLLILAAASGGFLLWENRLRAASGHTGSSDPSHQPSGPASSSAAAGPIDPGA